MKDALAGWTFRLLTLADVPALLDWYNDQELHHIAYTRTFTPYTLEQLTTHWKKKLNRPNADYYAIVLDGQVVGRVGFVKMPPEKVIAEYSILIGPRDLYGRGFGTAVTTGMVDVAFEDPKVKIVRLYVRQDNKRAIRCYEKVGFRHLHSFTQNGIATQMMQIERREWHGLVSERTGDKA